MSDCSCDCPCVSPRCLWRFPGSLLRTGRLLVVCSIWACLVSHPPLPPQCPELSRLNPPAQPGELLSRALHVPGRCYGTAKPPRALAPPLLWGPEIPWEEGKWGGAGRCHLALASPCCPGDAGSVPQVCPQLLCHGSPRASHRAGTPHCTQTITSALEPSTAWHPLALGQPSVLVPALSPGCGTAGDSLLLCHQPAHPPQGNQTLGIFWLFVVKLFPNSNRFKCHHTNGREKPFMQLQSGFLRWLGY